MAKTMTFFAALVLKGLKEDVKKPRVPSVSDKAFCTGKFWG
jgi:hypothetical protein